MASTWSDLKIQLMTTGENSTTWGTVTNANLGTAIEEAITGSADVTFASGDVTLTLTNTTSTQTARNLRLNLTGTVAAPQNLIVPAIEKVYIINNGLTQTITVKNSTGNGIAVPASKTMYVYNNGTDVVDAVNYLTSLTLGSALPVASGGTGVTTVGTAGNVLTSNGSAWASTAIPSQFITGMIMLWSGSIASIPSGWALCNGSNGTPDLRDKFVVGAGSTYAVAATGGSANAIVVAHTHTATTDSGGTNGSFGITGGGGSRMQGSASGGFSFSGSSTTRFFDESSGTTTTYASIDYTAAHTHTLTTASTGSSGTNANLPPYYALAYIMKL